jgi:alpha-amylase
MGFHHFGGGVCAGQHGDARAAGRRQSGRGSKALTLGALEPTLINNPQITSFYRNHEEESVLVLHNLSGQEQVVDLQQEKGFGQVYFLTAGQAVVGNNRATLPAYSTVILRKD